jgi:hypothetical protein
MQQNRRQKPLIGPRAMILLEILSEFASRGNIWQQELLAQQKRLLDKQ